MLVALGLHFTRYEMCLIFFRYNIKKDEKK